MVLCTCASFETVQLFDDNVDEAINWAKKLATAFPEIWCSPNDLFPCFHMCELEWERELQYVHTTHHVGVGAFVCQGVEALGHQINTLHRLVS